jgi:hypothetical protein
MKGLARTTSQLLFRNHPRQNKHFSGSVLPAPLGLSMPSSRRATVRFPTIRPTEIEL